MKTKNFKFKSMALVLFALVLSSNVWGETYTKVTSVTDGVYIIVNEASSRVFNGIDAVNDYVECTISDGVITSDDLGNCEVTIEAMTDGYSIKINSGTNSGKYISGKSGSNTIVYGTTAVANEITFSDGAATILSNSTSFRYNATSDQNRFRYYKTTTTGNSYIVPALYKKGASCANKVTVTKGTPSPSNGTFNLSQTGEVCIDEGDATVDVTDIQPAEHYHFSQITATNGTVDNVNKKVTDISDNTTINVEFAEDSKVTVTFSDAIHDNNSGYMEYVGDKIQFPTITDAAKGDGCVGEHYHFVGWTKDASQPNALVTPASETAPATGITYYAVWAKEDEE